MNIRSIVVLAALVGGCAQIPGTQTASIQGQPEAAEPARDCTPTNKPFGQYSNIWCDKDANGWRKSH